MITCPRCGRAADDEIVCAGCGRSLALVRRATTPDGPAALMDSLEFDEDEEAQPPDPRVWRLAALVVVCCLIVLAAAVLVLRSGGGTRKHAALSSPDVGASTSVATPAGSSSAASAPAPPVASPTSASPSVSRTPSHSARPSASSRGSSGSRTQASPAALTRSVRIAQGTPDAGCGPHCYRVVVTLSSFGSGTHRVTCLASRGGQFGAYDTGATTSTGCSYRRPNDTVWVVVDGRYRSNTIVW